MAGKVSYTEKLRQFLEAHPNEWIDGRRLSDVAGVYAWRTRVSEVRKLGLTIENRQRRMTNGVVVSQYCFIPCVDPNRKLF
jgi:hypothetical protein|tara:strand:+ start:5975 stop:6217 length:243 start_codon:yes stop_codon:yes gene_type:complete